MTIQHIETLGEMLANEPGVTAEGLVGYYENLPSSARNRGVMLLPVGNVVQICRDEIELAEVIRESIDAMQEKLDQKFNQWVKNLNPDHRFETKLRLTRLAAFMGYNLEVCELTPNSNKPISWDRIKIHSQ